MSARCNPESKTIRLHGSTTSAPTVCATSQVISGGKHRELIGLAEGLCLLTWSIPLAMFTGSKWNVVVAGFSGLRAFGTSQLSPRGG